MKRSKKFLEVILLMFMIWMMIPEMYAEAEEREGVWGYTVSVGEAEVTGYYGEATEVTIPSVLGGCPVTSIGRYIFEESDITSVTIPEGIEDIGSGAFKNCKYLESVSFYAKYCNGCLGVFENAGKFSDSFTLSCGEKVKVIPAGMFEGSCIRTVIMSESVEEIQQSAFEGCANLKEVFWGSQIKKIGSYAFKGCLSLESVTISSKMEEVGYEAFSNCKNLSSIQFFASYCEIGGSVFYNAGKQSDSLSVVFGAGVKEIPDGMFYDYWHDRNNYAKVTSVEIPASCTKIGNRVFERCYDLKTVTVKTKNMAFPEYDSYDPFAECSSSLVFLCYHNSTTAGYARKNGFQISYLDAAPAQTQTWGNAARYTVFAGDSLTLDKSGLSGKTIWRSSNSKVASVNSNGVVQAKKPGTAVISASVGGKTFKSTVKVDTVLSVSKTSITVPRRRKKAVTVTFRKGGSVSYHIKNGKYVSCSWGSFRGKKCKLTICGRKRGQTVVVIKNSYNNEKRKIKVRVR